jgi:uncharacterized protein (DUF2249 family)
MTDNSAALQRARHRDGSTKRQRALDTVTVMENDAESITFPAVARRAGVSVSFLYADVNLASRIATARDRQRQAGGERSWRLPVRSLVTEQSLRTDVANAAERVRRLTTEVAVLRERLALQLGEAADVARGHALNPLLDQLEQRSGELEIDNHRQGQRIAQLEAQNAELTETLSAARAMNRELMSELNRKAAGEQTPRRASSPQS